MGHHLAGISKNWNVSMGIYSFFCWPQLWPWDEITPATMQLRCYICVILYYIILWYIILYYVILYYIILYYSILYFIIYIYIYHLTDVVLPVKRTITIVDG